MRNIGLAHVYHVSKVEYSWWVGCRCLAQESGSTAKCFTGRYLGKCPSSGEGVKIQAFKNLEGQRVEGRALPIKTVKVAAYCQVVLMPSEEY